MVAAERGGGSADEEERASAWNVGVSEFELQTINIPISTRLPSDAKAATTKVVKGIYKNLEKGPSFRESKGIKI